MNKKELMKKAHQMTKEIKTQYPEVDYRFQFGLCLSFLMNEEEKEMEEKKLEIGLWNCKFEVRETEEIKTAEGRG